VIIAEGLLPVFFALAVGYFAGRMKIIANTHVEALDTLVMSFALPIALFTILAGSRRSDVLQHSAFALAAVSVMVAVYAGMFFVQRGLFHQTSQTAAIMALTVAYPNSAAIGLPLADSVLGGTGRLAVAVLLAVGSITISPTTIAILDKSIPPAPVGAGSDAAPPARRVGTARAIALALRNPIVIAPIAGIVWCLIGLPFPYLAESTLSAVGDITGGVALILTGLVLSTQRLSITPNVGVSAIVADVVRPLLALLAVKLFAITGPMAAETVLLLAVPSGFFGVLLAIAHHDDARLPGATLFYSILLSAATLSVVILLVPTLRS
jgi:predicted permease